MTKNEEERKRIGRRIAAIRQETGMTQEELAERAGLQPSNIARIERGLYGVSIDVLGNIAGVLGCKVDFIRL